MPRRLAIALAGVSAAIILVLTLAPSPASVNRLPTACFFCSEHATADALANVILFLPLGAALALARPHAPAWPWGLGLSLAIEFAQQWIPGRDPTVGDIVTNTIGTHLGWWATRAVASELRRPPRGRATAIVTATFVALIAGMVWLLGPAPTRALYFGGWTPVLGHLGWYRGQVLAATVDSQPLPVGPFSRDSAVRRLVASHGTLAVRAIAGPEVSELAPLVTVYDRHEREIMLLGPDRTALVFRFRRRAAALRLDAPDVRLDRAFVGVAARDTFDVRVTRDDHQACVALNERAACLPLATPGRTWSLIHYPESFSTGLRLALDAVWLAGLLAPVGWMAGWRRHAIGVAAVVAVTLAGLPLLGTVAAAPLAEWSAAGAGLSLGALLRRRFSP